MPGSMTWDAAADQQLLVGIFACHPDFKMNHDALAAWFQEKGHSCSAEAIRSRIKKIRKNVANGSGGDTSVVSTPLKPAAKTPSKTPKSQGKGQQDTETNEGEDSGTPSKTTSAQKTKPLKRGAGTQENIAEVKRPVKRAKQVKMEPKIEDSEILSTMQEHNDDNIETA